MAQYWTNQDRALQSVQNSSIHHQTESKKSWAGNRKYKTKSLRLGERATAIGSTHTRTCTHTLSRRGPRVSSLHAPYIYSMLWMCERAAMTEGEWISSYFDNKSEMLIGCWFQLQQWHLFSHQHSTGAEPALPWCIFEELAHILTGLMG